jgi:hypothetical protein
MVLCGYSSRNANVMYELGLRHAFDKPVVLIKDNKTEKVFDIQGLRYTEYDSTLRVDIVKNDINRISKALTDTSNPKNLELNSVIQLAKLRAATIPEETQISPDTQILLHAIESLQQQSSHREKTKSMDPYQPILK